MVMDLEILSKLCSNNMVDVEGGNCGGAVCHGGVHGVNVVVKGVRAGRINRHDA